MHRFISLLLIPLSLTGVPLPHSHGGTGVAESKEHDSRPHVHLGGHGHSHVRHGSHHHDDGDNSEHNSIVVSSFDHDADALYVTEFPTDGRRRQVDSTAKFTVGVLARELRSAGCPAVSPRWDVGCHPPDSGGSLPLYLRLASLRI